jgi:hypothetical protein
MKVRDLRKVLKALGRVHEQRGDKAVRKGLDAFANLLDGHDEESVREFMESIRKARQAR